MGFSKHNNSIVFLSICFILYTLSYFVTVEAIVGQKVKKAKTGEFPSNVALLKSRNSEPNENNLFCGGVLVSRTHVLTAAHCMEYKLINETIAIVGSRDIQCGLPYSILWSVDYNRWAIYKKVRKYFRVNDIAIVKLKNEVPDVIVIGTFSAAKSEDLYGSTVTVAGWGKTESGAFSRVLKKVALQILTQTECEHKIAAFQELSIPIHSRILCSNAEPYALMHIGDGGNPVFRKGKIVAVHKSTNPLPDQPIHPDKVNVHTGIEFYRDFIEDILSSYSTW